MDVNALLADPVATGAIVGAVALILFAAAWHKVARPGDFLSSVAAYRLLPDVLLGPAARCLPIVEIGIGVGMLVPPARMMAMVAAAALFGGYGVAMAVNLLRGRSHIDCGCGGAAQPLSWALVARNAVLAAILVAASGPIADRGLGWLDGVVLIGGALAFLMAHLLADELLRQRSRMQRTATDTGSSGS